MLALISDSLYLLFPRRLQFARTMEAQSAVAPPSYSMLAIMVVTLVRKEEPVLFTERHSIIPFRS